MYISYNKNDCLNTLVYNGSEISKYSSNKYSSNHFYEKYYYIKVY